MGYPNLRNFACSPACIKQLPSSDRTSLLSILPQDRDDCLGGTHLCAQLCTDGWYDGMRAVCFVLVSFVSFSCLCTDGWDCLISCRLVFCFVLFFVAE
jgi:hypothetical protein